MLIRDHSPILRTSTRTPRTPSHLRHHRYCYHAITGVVLPPCTSAMRKRECERHGVDESTVSLYRAIRYWQYGPVGQWRAERAYYANPDRIGN